MTLAEFLEQTDIAAMSATDAVVAARARTEGRIWRINDAERKIAVVTRLIMENTLPRLEAVRDDTTRPTALRELARKLRETLDTRLLYEPDYFINLGNAEVSAGYAAAVQFGLLTQTELDAFNLAATHIETPFANTTLKDVLLHRGEMVYKEITNPVIENDYLKIEVTNEVAEFNPQVYKQTHGVMQRFTGFNKVNGVYLAFINKNRGTFFVDDEYGVVV